VDPETYSFEDDDAIPNPRLPVLIYRELEAAQDAGACEELFDSNASPRRVESGAGGIEAASSITNDRHLQA
jgi:uncharacterized protein YjlB